MKLTVGQIFELIKQSHTKEQRAEIMRDQSNNDFFKSLVKAAYDDRIEFNLPEGTPDYRPNPCPIGLSFVNLTTELRKLHYFIKGESSNKLPRSKRESMFIQLLEALDAQEAKVFLAVKSKNLEDYGITKVLVEEVYPGLINSKDRTDDSVTMSNVSFSFVMPKQMKLPPDMTEHSKVLLNWVNQVLKNACTQQKIPVMSVNYADVQVDVKPLEAK